MSRQINRFVNVVVLNFTPNTTDILLGIPERLLLACKLTAIIFVTCLQLLFVAGESLFHIWKSDLVRSLS